METVVVRKMLVEDIPHVAEIENKCFPTPWSKSAFEKEIKKNILAVYVVGVVGDKVVSYGGMWLIVDEGHITNIAVDPDYQGRRIGEKVTRALIKQAEEKMLNRITLEVRKSNHIAQKLYHKLGFKVCGIRPEYYSDNGEDALIMWKEIDRVFI